MMVHLPGRPDGRSEVDETVDHQVGFPLVTGSRLWLGIPLIPTLAQAGEPSPACMGLHWRSNVHGGLAGRRAAPPPQDREGQFVWLAPNDVALAMLGHLRKIAGVTINASDRPKDGDYLFGAFGRAFGTLDGRRVMVVGLTKAQWTSLCTATGLGEELEAFGAWRGLD